MRKEKEFMKLMNIAFDLIELGKREEGGKIIKDLRNNYPEMWNEFVLANAIGVDAAGYDVRIWLNQLV